MLNIEDIKRLISNDEFSEKKRFAKVGVDYYEGKHDILNYRLFYYDADGQPKEDKTRSNIKICHPFFTELADQLSSYMLSFKENPIRANESVKELQKHLDSYFDDEFWAEIGDVITGAYTKGFEYIYGYVNEEERTVFQCADSMGVVEVREEDTDDHCKYIIYWYIDRIEKGRKEIRRIQVWSENDVTFYVQDGANGEIVIDEFAKINPRPHIIMSNEKGDQRGMPLGYIPFWRLDNNKKQISGLMPVKQLIDDYDLMQCSLSNNLQDLTEGIYVVKGFAGDDMDELITNVKTKKAVGVSEEGDIDIRTVSIPYEARKVKADEDEKNIYRFGFGFNSAQVGDGNITNVVIRSRYTLLDLKANKMEKNLRKLLRKIIKVVLEEINKEYGTGYTLADIYFEFTRDIMTNETENIQNAKIEAETEQIRLTSILNIAINIGDEQALRAICDVMEWDYDELQAKLNALGDGTNLADAQKLLDGVETTEETETTPIPTQTPAAPVEEAEEAIGKALNGAQTTSLLSIIAQYKQGQLDAEEATAIISLAIGISEQKAKKLLKLNN